MNPDPIRIRNTDLKYLGLGLEVAAESGHDVDEHVDAALSRVLLHAFRAVLHVADTAVVQRVPDRKRKCSLPLFSRNCGEISMSNCQFFKNLFDYHCFLMKNSVAKWATFSQLSPIAAVNLARVVLVNLSRKFREIQHKFSFHHKRTRHTFVA